MKQLTLQIEGMTCGHCEITVQEAVRKVDGVKKAKASKRKKQLVVEFDEAVASSDEISDAVAATGYEVVGIV